jgi:PhnB protein
MCYKEQRMPVTLTPYLHFRGNTREAMEFYHSVLGGELNLQTFKDVHAAQDPSNDDLVMHAHLDGDNGLVVMASDPPSRMQYDLGKRVHTTRGRSHPC